MRSFIYSSILSLFKKRINKIWVEEIYIPYYYFFGAERKRKFRLCKFLEPHMQVLYDVRIFCF